MVLGSCLLASLMSRIACSECGSLGFRQSLVNGNVEAEREEEKNGRREESMGELGGGNRRRE